MRSVAVVVASVVSFELSAVIAHVLHVLDDASAPVGRVQYLAIVLLASGAVPALTISMSPVMLAFMPRPAVVEPVPFPGYCSLHAFSFAH